MNRPKHDNRARDGRGRRRHRHGADERRDSHPIHLTGEGVPAAIPDAPRPSPVVFVSEASLTRYPWLPGRVVAGSVWRGPAHERVQVDETGTAVPWRCGPGTARGA